MLTLYTTLAAFSPNSLFHLLIGVIVAGLIAWLLWWLIGFIGLPEPFAKIARALVAIVCVLFLIGLLLNVAGYPVWRNSNGP